MCQVQFLLIFERWFSVLLIPPLQMSCRSPAEILAAQSHFHHCANAHGWSLEKQLPLLTVPCSDAVSTGCECCRKQQPLCCFRQTPCFSVPRAPEEWLIAIALADAFSSLLWGFSCFVAGAQWSERNAISNMHSFPVAQIKPMSKHALQGKECLYKYMSVFVLFRVQKPKMKWQIG